MKVFNQCKNFILHHRTNHTPAGAVACIKPYRVKTCKMIDAERRDRKDPVRTRHYAHVGHCKNKVCVASAFERLPQKYQVGILLHEFGHVLTDGGDEMQADVAIHEMTGVVIEYDKEQALEYVLPIVARAIMDL